MHLNKLMPFAFAVILAIFPSFAAVAYENGFPTDPGFFPIGVWLQSPANAPEYKAIGINTFVGLWEGPTELQLALDRIATVDSTGRVAFGPGRKRLSSRRPPRSLWS
jgi:hypothetical protein